MSPENIRSIRVRSGLTQVEFARALSVAQSTVSQWELGKKRPGDPYVATLRRWDQHLSRMEKDARRSWAQELVTAAVSAGLFAVLMKLFGDE